MGLEAGTYISDLNVLNPVASDPKSQGDDHLRLIKATLKTTFPNVNGVVSGTPAELNGMVGQNTGVTVTPIANVASTVFIRKITSKIWTIYGFLTQQTGGAIDATGAYAWASFPGTLVNNLTQVPASFQSATAHDSASIRFLQNGANVSICPQRLVGASTGGTVADQTIYHFVAVLDFT